MNLTDNEATQLIQNSKLPIILYFWAPSCKACCQFMLLFEEIELLYKGKAIFGKINIDDGQAVSSKYNVRSLPTSLIFINGILQDTKIGVKTKSDYLAFTSLNIGKY